ncbi:RNA methyltransferase [uncultured Clostridium sp.]|uniref:TrmH family RNA methyltransferase n=1 Tax=uncultured Clostridium sp. TaxID=59620 RepID=UPI00261B5E1E|nr:RNA methyltransferase [uncultured Clostridium sp.]
MLIIESKSNSLFKNLKKLKDKKYRNQTGTYLIEGLRFVDEAFKSGVNIESIMYTQEFKEKNDEFLARGKDINNIMLSLPLLKELSFTGTPQGVMAIVHMENKELKDGNIVVLVDKVQDPGNMGTIIRTAHAVGASGIIMTKGTVDIYNDKVLRSTMGSVFYLPIIEDFELSKINELKENGYKLVVSSLQGEKNFFEEDLKGNIIMAVGNEGNGVSDEVYNISDIKVRIPMPGNAESLNVAVATSVMLYEKVRQNIVK